MNWLETKTKIDDALRAASAAVASASWDERKYLVEAATNIIAMNLQNVEEVEDAVRRLKQTFVSWNGSFSNGEP